jgi:hypothetical protein
VRFGDLASCDEAVGRVVGFPRFQVDRSVGSDTEHVTGTIAPQTGVVSGRWQMKVTGDIPPSRWEGLSGAAVFTAGILIGIVTEACANSPPHGSAWNLSPASPSNRASPTPGAG